MNMRRTWRFLPILAVVVFVPRVASACLWSYGTSLRGEKITVAELRRGPIVADLNRFESRAFWEQKLKAHAARQGGNHRVQNDHAVALLHLGQVKPAIAILLQIEREQPGLYPTAANLGTAHELAGDDRAALQWIRESINRNREAHDQTEWLHVRILEAKLALRDDPRWLETHSILGLGFGTAVIPKLPRSFPAGNAGKPLNADGVKDALWYQLDERYQFVRPPDAIVGSLLFDWANLMVRTETLESAAELYREALRYKVPHGDLATRRLQRVEQSLRDFRLRGKR